MAKIVSSAGEFVFFVSIIVIPEVVPACQLSQAAKRRPEALSYSISCVLLHRSAGVVESEILHRFTSSEASNGVILVSIY